MEKNGQQQSLKGKPSRALRGIKTRHNYRLPLHEERTINTSIILPLLFGSKLCWYQSNNDKKINHQLKDSEGDPLIISYFMKSDEEMQV